VWLKVFIVRLLGQRKNEGEKYGGEEHERGNQNTSQGGEESKIIQVDVWLKLQSQFGLLNC
jgi:hypothetical protein